MKRKVGHGKGRGKWGMGNEEECGGCRIEGEGEVSEAKPSMTALCDG